MKRTCTMFDFLINKKNGNGKPEQPERLSSETLENTPARFSLNTVSIERNFVVRIIEITIINSITCWRWSQNAFNRVNSVLRKNLKFLFDQNHKRNLRFQIRRLERYPWLAYSAQANDALCAYCVFYRQIIELITQITSLLLWYCSKSDRYYIFRLKPSPRGNPGHAPGCAYVVYLCRRSLLWVYRTFALLC